MEVIVKKTGVIMPRKITQDHQTRLHMAVTVYDDRFSYLSDYVLPIKSKSFYHV